MMKLLHEQADGYRIEVQFPFFRESEKERKRKVSIWQRKSEAFLESKQLWRRRGLYLDRFSLETQYGGTILQTVKLLLLFGFGGGGQCPWVTNIFLMGGDVILLVVGLL